MAGLLLDLAPRARKPRRASRLYARHSLAQGLVARWLFAEGAGTTVRSLNQVLPGVITNPTNSTSGWTTGLDGPEWFIGPVTVGDTSYLAVNAIPVPSLCSYEALWITGTGVSNTGMLGTTDGTISNGTTDRSLWTDITGHLGCYIFDGGVKTAITAGALNTGQRYHAVVTVDGSNLTLYLDGVQVAQTAAGGAYTGYTTPSFYFGAGTQPGAGAQGLGSGTLITCGMWSRGLTAAEVRTLYQAPWDMAVAPGRILPYLSQPAAAAVAADYIPYDPWPQLAPILTQ